MAIQAIGEVLMTSDMGVKPTAFQAFAPKRNALIKSVRPQIIFFNDPQFTTLAIELWKISGGSLWKKIAESLPRKKSGLIQDLYAIGHYYFEFETFPSLKKANDYALVLRANGYSGDDSSHIAWVKEADPFMEHVVSPVEPSQISRAPFSISVIGDRF